MKENKYPHYEQHLKNIESAFDKLKKDECCRLNKVLNNRNKA